MRLGASTLQVSIHMMCFFLFVASQDTWNPLKPGFHLNKCRQRESRVKLGVYLGSKLGLELFACVFLEDPVWIGFKRTPNGSPPYILESPPTKRHTPYGHTGKGVFFGYAQFLVGLKTGQHLRPDHQKAAKTSGKPNSKWSKTSAKRRRG